MAPTKQTARTLTGGIVSQSLCATAGQIANPNTPDTVNKLMQGSSDHLDDDVVKRLFGGTPRIINEQPVVTLSSCRWIMPYAGVNEIDMFLADHLFWLKYIEKNTTKLFICKRKLPGSNCLLKLQTNRCSTLEPKCIGDPMSTKAYTKAYGTMSSNSLWTPISRHSKTRVIR